MTRIAQLEGTEQDTPLVRRQSTDGITPDVTSTRPEGLVPTDARKQPPIRNDSIVGAITSLVALVLGFLSR
jgi:hypothetical protein